MSNRSESSIGTIVVTAIAFVMIVPPAGRPESQAPGSRARLASGFDATRVLVDVTIPHG